MSAVAAAGVAMLVLGACGGPSVDSGSGTGSGSGSEQSGTASEAIDWASIEPATEISFWTNHPGGSQAVEQELVAAFTAETGIKVDLVTAGANYAEVSQRFQTAQTGGDQGDLVVLSDANWFNAYLAGSIRPVDELLPAVDIQSSDYVDALYEDYLYEGAHYALPYARSTPLFYYNKAHYADAGLPDEAPKTWDQVKEYSEKLKAAGHSTPFGFPPEAEYPAWTMANLVWSYGGQWSNEWDFTAAYSPETIEALTFAQNAIKDGWATVVSSAPQTDYAAGGASQVIASTGALSSTLSTAGFDVGVGFLPTGPTGDENVVPTGGAGIAIASKSSPERQKAAAMLATFLTNAQSTATFSQGTGYLPVQKSADMSDVYAEKPQFEVAVNQLSRARVQDFGRVLLPGGDLTLSGALAQILSQGADPKTAMEGAANEMQSLYDRDLKALLEK